MGGKDELTRFGVSFPAALIEQFDRYITEQGYHNRSEAIRDLARKALLEPSSLHSDDLVAGTIVLVYNHHVSELPLLLTDIQHHHHQDIISTMHIHLNHDQCLEVIVVKGALNSLRKLHQQIQVQKGVVYAELSVTYASAAAREDAHPALQPSTEPDRDT
ncbi:nickel-responsive transcriptional regulator NikR [Paenibacillus sambharensis]|uniref:Putative nickel-responsive regulator n=1 Tax=Paenibacillus sambharensis TaxID=1803190 RepID=A0A2W1LXC3_9BACL|nr:nickel-responsive transcriptional regulator NikR [Paenibacillus sambharensis]PZD96177.1 nickel-responsive transcriptional regulator NikR [Paenibacillus sambharensis]